jgi:hypothetical protein
VRETPKMGDAGAGGAATLRVSKKGVWGRSPRRLDCEGGGGRNRLLSFFDERQAWNRDQSGLPRVGFPMELLEGQFRALSENSSFDLSDRAIEGFRQSAPRLRSRQRPGTGQVTPT